MLRAQTTAPARSLRIIRAIGESMSPEIPPGTRVVVDTEDRAPSPPGIFVVFDGMGLVLKRVEYVMFSDPAKIRLSSVNPAYPPYECALDEKTIKGRVIGRWAWM
jgi:phage repressor protein C with HTH and peptisase S24 domain